MSKLGSYEVNTIVVGNCLGVLRQIPDGVFQMCATSPPYWGLRDYGILPVVYGGDPLCAHEWGAPGTIHTGGIQKDEYGGQRVGRDFSAQNAVRDRATGQFCQKCSAWLGSLGLEPTPELYVEHIVEVFREVKRVLRDDGVLFLNLGDSYASSSLDKSSYMWYNLREDLTNEEVQYVAVEMFGVRLNRDPQEGAGAVPEVLSQTVSGKSQRGMEGVRENLLPEAQSRVLAQDHREAEGRSQENNPGTREQVRMLRGDAIRVSDDRSHQQRWGGTSETARATTQDLQRNREGRLSQGQVPDSVLQLQLLHRCLRVLSSSKIRREVIPEALLYYFEPASPLKPKDLIGVPWMIAFALRADGWYLRSDVIWAKPNCMPESVRDRPTKSHEYVFLMSKSKRYYYDRDAIREPHVDPADIHRRIRKDGEYKHGKSQRGWMQGSEERADRAVSRGRNKRTVWTISTHPFPKAHFATFPPKLVEPMIKAGTSEQGACPECGKAWARVVERTVGTSKDCPKTVAAHHARGGTGNPVGTLGQSGGGRVGGKTRTIGWQPACPCGLPDGFEPDDFELIETPTGERVDEDPSLVTGRAGYNRPRGLNEGKRFITRYEQRKYAERLRNSPSRTKMEAQAGSAFEHYIRTDKSGARPIPPGLLEAWLEQGWLEQVQVPEWTPPAPVPQIVLDPFSGAGTALMVADGLKRDWLGIEINPDYVKMALDRIAKDRVKRQQLEMF